MELAKEEDFTWVFLKIMRYCLVDLGIISITSLYCICYFYSRALQLEEEYMKQMCDEIIAVKPDLIFTEKGVSGKDETVELTFSDKTSKKLSFLSFLDLAQHYLLKANITAIRRIKKTDNNRISRWEGERNLDKA